ncbi:MAG TPA: glycosyltransferase family 4 protein [Oligoflexia bacterium]|nr:glycosyltransferase family 4 protein [Oligoflexia bacterium]
MRIASFAWETLHSIPVGGVAVHVTELAAALQRRGHDVHVFCRIGPGQSGYDLRDGVHYHRCPLALHPDFVTEMNNMCNSFMWRVGETEKVIGGAFDIFHGHDWMCTKAIAQAKNNWGRRTVLTIHSTEYGRCGNNNYNGNCDRVRWVEAEGTYIADRVITVSGVLADEVKWLYRVPDWKLRTVHNGINVHRFDGYIDPSICRRTYGIGPTDPMALFVGRMSRQKGPDLLLEAVPYVLPHRWNAKFVFVGDGDMRWSLEQRAWHMGVAQACRFLGGMNANSDLENIYKSADVVCVPSRNEPFGIVVLEAWAAGKPVLATHNGGPREFVTHDRTGYLIYDNPGSVAWGIMQIFNNFDHARWMGEQGRATAAYGFSWDRIAGDTEGIYRELVWWC